MKRVLWFPPLSAWLSAFKLAIPTYLGATFLFLFEFWRYLIVITLTLSSSNSSNTFFLLFPFLSLIAGLIWYLLLIGLYSLVLKILWSQPPQWLQPPKHLASVILNFVIALLATLPVAGAFALLILTNRIAEQLAGQDIRYLLLGDFVPKTFILWLITATYLLHWLRGKSTKHMLKTEPPK